MKIYILKYMVLGDVIDIKDFQDYDKTVRINLDFVLSVSDPIVFELPVDKYAVVTMSNDDTYFIREDVFMELSDILDQHQMERYDYLNDL